LILLCAWLAPAVLASLGMLWCGWVQPALARPRRPIVPEVAGGSSGQIRLPAEPEADEAAGDRSARSIPSPMAPSPGPCRRAP